MNNQNAADFLKWCVDVALLESKMSDENKKKLADVELIIKLIVINIANQLDLPTETAAMLISSDLSVYAQDLRDGEKE